MKLVLLSFIFGLGLSACNSGINYKFSPPAPEEPVGSSKNPTPEPSPIVIPTATPEVPGTPLPMPGSTVTPTPTSTSTPTVPPTATPTVSPAPSPTPVSSPTPIEEVVDAPTVLGILDILFVVDNSPSMKEDQAKLATKFPKFTDELKDLDWQIGITTTDTTKKGVDGTLLPYADDKFNLTNNFVLRPGMLPSQASFENTIMRKEVGSGFEMPIKASLHALQKRADYPNNSFFRNGSNFSIIIISDEDEDSTGRNAEGDGIGHEPWTTENEPQNLVNYVSGLNFSSFSVSTISIIPNDKKCKSSHGNGHYSNVYKELVLLTKGFMGSICDKDFTGTLKSIAQTIKAPITTITLSREPVPGSVKVELDPLDPAATYTVNGSKIIFNKTLSRGTKIKVTYLPK